MEEVSVIRCNKPLEWARENRVFEHEGHLIRLGEAPATLFTSAALFRADIHKMCWITETGECTEMTVDEKKECIDQIKKWNRRERRKGRMRVRFVDTTKGIYVLSRKQQNMIGFACAGIIIAMMFIAWVVLPLLSCFNLL